MRIVFRRRSLKEIKERLLTKDWELSSLMGWAGIFVLLMALFVCVESVHEIAYANPARLRQVYRVIDNMEIADSYRGNTYIRVSTSNGDVYHIQEYALPGTLEEEYRFLQEAAGGLIKLQHYDPLVSSVPQILGISSAEEIYLDAEESCRLSREHSAGLLAGFGIAGIMALFFALLPAMGVVQIRTKSGKIYIE